MHRPLRIVNLCLLELSVPWLARFFGHCVFLAVSFPYGLKIRFFTTVFYVDFWWSFTL